MTSESNNTSSNFDIGSDVTLHCSEDICTISSTLNEELARCPAVTAGANDTSPADIALQRSIVYR